MIPTVRIDRPSVGALAAPGDVLSPSRVGSIMDCAYRLGRAVHVALAANFEQKCDSKIDVLVTGVRAVYREAWAILSEGIEFRDDEDPDEPGETGEALVVK